MGIGKLGGFLHLGVGRLRAPVADVVADRAFEKVGLLRDVSEVMAQGRLGDMRNVLSVDQDAAFRRIVEARQKRNDGRLAGTGRPHKRGGLSAFRHRLTPFRISSPLP